MIHTVSEPALNATRPVATPTLGSAYGGRSSTGPPHGGTGPGASSVKLRSTIYFHDGGRAPNPAKLSPVGRILLALAALLSNAIFFINPPGQNALPWLSLVVAIISVISWQEVSGSLQMRGAAIARRVLGSVLALLSLGLARRGEVFCV